MGINLSTEAPIISRPEKAECREDEQFRTEGIHLSTEAPIISRPEKAECREDEQFRTEGIHLSTEAPFISRPEKAECKEDEQFRTEEREEILLEKMQTEKKRSKDKKGLGDLVLSWKIEDVLNDDLYGQKIRKIPQSFKSLKHYFETYLDPLAEETRAELSSSLESLSEAPYVQLTSIESNSKKLSFTVHFGAWKRLCNGGKEPYKPLPGDIFIILDAKPKSIDILQRKSKTWPLAWLPYAAFGSSSLKIQSSEDIRAEDCTQKKLYLVFLANILPNARVWSSLNFHGNVKIIERLLSPKRMSDKTCMECSAYNNAVRAEKMALKLSTMLNESQRAAVQACLCKMLCDHKPSVELIWGPPGTGKTKTVSMLLWTILELKSRALVCAPTNVAITELASRVVKLLKEQPERDYLSGSFGLGDLLLFGNKDRLKFGPELDDIYMDYRVDKLMECLGAQKGWRYHLNSLIKLLEDSYSLYHEFLEQKKGNNGGTTFLGFMRERFRIIASKLSECLQILSNHMPRKLISKRNLQRMNSLVKVASFEDLLCSHDMVSEELEKLCLRLKNNQNNQPTGSVYEIFVHSMEACLSELRDLLKSLAHLPSLNSSNKKSAEKFIYQGASMIFCTASSSCKLNSKKIEPIDMLIIDEAAQLKECESTIPLQVPGIKHAILIGDELQLPAIVKSKVSEEAGFGRSLFERLSLLGHRKCLLNVQYRMHPSVSCFPNSKFYANQILNAPSVMDGSYEKRYLPGPLFGPFSFINVAGGEERNGVKTSFKNMAEVAVVVELIKKLHKEWSSSHRKISIGVISPYAAQIVAIQEKLRPDFTEQDGFTVKVKSVDGFQGGEEDVIVISSVRSNSRKKIGFLSNPQRINVALTRARHCLWILGDERTLGNSGSDWAAVICNAKDRRCFFNADEDEDLANAVIEANVELCQFDDLLSKDSILFRKTRWEVLFSKNFRESFIERLSPSQKKNIMVFLLRLSVGWRPDNGRFSFYKGSGSHVLKHVKVEGIYITYSIDIQKDSKYKQVLKIWDIKPLEVVHKLDKCISAIYKKYTDDFLLRCTEKCQEGNLEVPLSWSVSSDLALFKDNANSISSLKATEQLQMGFQSFSYQKVHYLLSGCDGKKLDLPIQVSDQQFEIIIFPKSSFIIGRPGAAKTSCLTIKMFQREQRHSISREEGINGERGRDGCDTTFLRQLFVTVTSKQCLFVKQHLSLFKRDSSIGHGLDKIENGLASMHDLYDVDRFSDSPNSFLDASSKSYPLVITYRKFLTMLDRSIGASYFRKFHRLFEPPHYKATSPISTSLRTFIRMKEVNCSKFASSYWPNFDKQLTKKLDAFLVFNEIVFQIKGGFRDQETNDGILNREEYALLGKGYFSTLSKKQRENIYDIFLDYEKTKKEKEEYDLSDLVNDLHDRLKNTEYLGQKMDFLYLDEVQDLSMRQISLFKFVCRNFDTSVVFSANTAQTIARFGFRFQDIRLLFHEEFLSRSRGLTNSSGTGFPQLPDIFHLSQNLPTQPKVLRLAQSITDLLFRFFPSCIDILSPETSDTSVIDVEVETPILLLYENDEDAFKTVLKDSKDGQKNNFNLGPEQVILVRDDLAREKIINLLGNQSLVLTIMECQCLEFSDVLLYDFFGSSSLERHWNVVYEYMQEQLMLESPCSGPFPNFNHERYRDLCWELKLLYVAITRSRKRLWICEDKQTLSHPVFDYWKKMSLVQVSQFDKSIIETVHGSKEEWNSRGLELFSDGIFGMASMCFQMAEDIHREKWARAAFLRVAAENMIYEFPEASQNAFQEASDIFHSIGNFEVAIQCLVESRQYEKAAALYSTKCGEDALEEVGDCYTEAGCFGMAANIYSRGNHFTKCIHVCAFSNMFDMGLKLIQQWGESRILDADSKSTKEMKHMFLEKGALHFNQVENHQKMMIFVRAFDCMDSKRSFLGKLNLLDDLFILEKENKNFVEAANIAMKKGDLLLEIDLLEEAGHYRDASSLLLLYVYFHSLWASGEQGWPLTNFTNKEELLKKAEDLAIKESHAFYDNIRAEANILSNHTTSLSDMNPWWIYSRECRIVNGIVMSTWQIIDLHLSLNASDYDFECRKDLELSKHVEEIISQNKVCFHSLIYCWNIWKEMILDIISHLGSLRNKDCCDSFDYQEFCLRYFGVRKDINGENITYLLLNSGAAWITKDFSYCTTTNLVNVDSNQLILLANNYWCSEIIGVGMKVLKKITDLQKLSIGVSLSPVLLCSITLDITKMCQFLTDDEHLKPFIGPSALHEIFDIGLKSIQYFRQHCSVDDGIKEIDEISHAFLLKCAISYHNQQDADSMMKFVQAFGSVESKRSFFKGFGHSKKLQVLELDNGNYAEAIAIAKSTGNLFLELNLLEISGQYKDASLLLLSYVFANFGWPTRSERLPLKEFQEKKQLLDRAKSLAKQDSSSLYEVIHAEANIMSNKCQSLSEILQDLKVSERLKSFRGIVLSSWKILDTHFLLTESNYNPEIESVKYLKKHSETTISQNKVSAETLMYFWKSWKDNMVKIFDYLSSFGAGNATECETYETFCLFFLGVRNQVDDGLSVYQLIKSDAKWVREVDSELGSIQRKGDIICLNSSQFVYAAWNYWSSEVLSVSMNVLEKLKSLYFFSVEMSFSELRQCTIVIYILQLVEFFKESMIGCCSYREKFISRDKIEEMKQFFLERFDLHRHKLRDDKTMMKFVYTFDSKDSKRLFFNSLGCEHELSSLKGNSDKFLEGIAAARLNGELFEEVDLLHAEGQYKEASELILSFVLAKSLWGTKAKGWPLKPFEQRKELLLKAKSYAKLHQSPEFYNIVCTEARILYEMKNQLTISPENRNITLELLSARKILDAHFHLDASKHEWENKRSTEKVSDIKLSFDTLVYHWNVWKDKIVCIIKFFECIELNKTVSTEYEELALKYLGVRKWFDDKTTYQLLIPDADWVRHVDESAIKRFGEAVTINTGSLAIAGQKFWSEDMISVGMKVLKHLEALQMYSLNNYASVLHQVSIHVVEVANFLKEFSCFSKFVVDRKVSQLLQSSFECFFDCVFGLDWIKPVTQNMVALRETSLFMVVFEAIILKNVNPESDLTNEKIGKIVMAVFGSKRLNVQIYKKVSERLAKNSPWKALIDEYSSHAASSVEKHSAKGKEVKENQGENLLNLKLHKALMDYYSTWRREINPISPNCFLYIIERHFILLSRFQECFYATRSLFVEWLVCDEFSLFAKHHGEEKPTQEMYDFIANMTQQFLCNDCGAREWIKRANINSKEYYPSFLLRLVMLMCLLCANSDKYHDMLRNIVSRRDIASHLPAEFNGMLKKKRRNDQFICDLAEVLWKMKNPLLKLCYNTDVCNEGGAKKCIGVGMKKFQKKEDVLRAVFKNDGKQTNNQKVEYYVKGDLRNASTSSRS